MQNVTMAKVITMKTKTINNCTIVMVSTVDPSATPEMVRVKYGVPGFIISAEETDSMPLGFALDYFRRQREKLGITNYVSFINNRAA